MSIIIEMFFQHKNTQKNINLTIFSYLALDIFLRKET